MTKRIVFYVSIWALFAAGQVYSQNTFDGFMFGWRFAKGDQTAAVSPEFDDSGWEQVDLPHDWAISGPFGKMTDHGGQAKLPWRGQGWYRKTFELPRSAKGKRLQFIFDGVMASPVVYLNGKKVGSWIYGYNSFHVDATDAANFGGTNVLTVHANTYAHFSRWYPGGGIYRKVTPRLVDPVHIPVWGVFVTTPQVKDDLATVNAKVEVTNAAAEKTTVTVETVLLDPSGKEAAKERVNVAVAPGKTETASLDILVKNPQRWDVDDPLLYMAVTRLIVTGRQTHCTQTPFGIRTIEWTVDDGVHVNGRRVQIQGVNLHHDHGPLGSAFYPRAMERQLEIMQEMGVNSVRTSHNASAPELLELCDKMGILVFGELFDKFGWYAGVNCSIDEYFSKYARSEVRNYMRRDRNHPCVYAWAVSNENGELVDNREGKAGKRMETIVNIFKEFDTTRPITVAVNGPSTARRENKVLDSLDAVGWNYQEKYLVSRENYPEKPLILSESASAFVTRGAYKFPIPKHKTDFDLYGHCSGYALPHPGPISLKLR